MRSERSSAGIPPTEDKPTIDATGIAEALKRLGLRSGQHVLVHSSLSSLGRVDGGAAAVVQALLDVLGPDGTLLAPTLTGNEWIEPGSEWHFDAETTEGWTGAISETVRSWPGAVRSLHPTHSVAAIGAAATTLTQGHEDCITPCGAGSPYRRLADESSGKILLLGCDHESNTTLHAVEEIAEVPYHLHEQPIHATIRSGSATLKRTTWIHRYGTPRRFNAIEPLLLERGMEVRGQVGNAEARLISAADIVAVGSSVLAAAPSFFLERDHL